MTRLFVEQPLASPGSAKKGGTHFCIGFVSFFSQKLQSFRVNEVKMWVIFGNRGGKGCINLLNMYVTVFKLKSYKIFPHREHFVNYCLKQYHIVKLGLKKRWILITWRYSPLPGLTSSSCRGLWPLVEAFFGQKKSFSRCLC